MSRVILPLAKFFVRDTGGTNRANRCKSDDYEDDDVHCGNTLTYYCVGVKISLRFL
jgi:hypothetical protein